MSRPTWHVATVSRARQGLACVTRRPWEHTRQRVARKMSTVATENSLLRQTSYNFLLQQRFSVATDFSRSSIATENPGTWDFLMSEHRAYVMIVHGRGAHTTDIFGFV